MVRRAVLTCLVLSVGIAVAAALVPGIDVTGGFWTYLWLGVLFGLVNAILGPILHILALPLTVITLGLFALVVNGVLLATTAGLSDHLDVGGFLGTILGRAGHLDRDRGAGGPGASSARAAGVTHKAESRPLFASSRDGRTFTFDHTDTSLMVGDVVVLTRAEGGTLLGQVLDAPLTPGSTGSMGGLLVGELRPDGGVGPVPRQPFRRRPGRGCFRG